MTETAGPAAARYEPDGPVAVAADRRLVNQVHADAGFLRPAGPLGGAR